MKALLSFSAFLTVSLAVRLTAADVPADVILAAERAGMSQAKQLAVGGNLKQAEATLAALNRSKSGTADWYMETAQRLIQTADQLARGATTQNIGAVVASALDQLDQAEKAAANNEDRAAAKTLAGFVYERFLADEDEARKKYQAAVELAPTKTKQAAEASDRLKRHADDLKGKKNGLVK